MVKRLYNFYATPIGVAPRPTIRKSIDLGMIAGGLINQSDSSIGIFVPDVKRPKTKKYSQCLFKKDFL